jgi:subtilisin family serine protease
MRARKVWLALGLLVVAIGGGTFLTGQQPAGKAKEKAAPAGGPIAIKAAKGLKSAPSTLVALAKARSPRAATGAKDTGEIDTYYDGTTTYVVLNLEFDSAESCSKFAVPGVKVITRHEKWADIFMPDSKEAEKAVTGAEGLVWFDYDAYGIVPPPSRPIPRKETPRSIPDKIVQGGISGLTGKGVVLAVIDTGLDFRHPDFNTYDAKGQPTSRCLYFYDTTSDSYANGVGDASPYSYPNGASIGTIYSRETLTAEMRSGKHQIPTWDPNGHGTACAGVAAGNGNLNAKYKGVAPNVDLIGVRVASGQGGFENGYMLNAICEWLDKVAGDRPLVISCSYGGQYGGRDGYFVSERHLSSRFPMEKKSRAILFAAGNEGTDALHATATVAGKEEPGSITWITPQGGLIEIYVQTDAENDLWLNPVASNFKVTESFVHPLTKHSVVTIETSPGRGGLTIHSGSGAKYQADAYIKFAGAYPAAFTGECQAFDHQVGTPGSSHNVLTVGSYNWNDLFEMHGETRVMADSAGEPFAIGEISNYSSPGPLRFGDIVKPEIVAPGQWYAAAAPLNAAVVFGRDTTGHYTMHNGTSAATPYAAGVIALLFEAKPHMTWGEVRKVLTESVTQDTITGDCPNPKWGHGKLDYAAVERAVKKVVTK